MYLHICVLIIKISINDLFLIHLQVALLFRIMGALRIDELTNITTEHVQYHGQVMLGEIPTTKTKISKSFTISDEYYTVVNKFVKLRSESVPHNRFFVNYLPKTQKCSIQPIGKNKFSSMPREIATYLKLPPESYTDKLRTFYKFK